MTPDAGAGLPPPELVRAIQDPGSFTPRGGYLGQESFTYWQARAVLAAGFHYCGCDGFAAKDTP